MSDLDRDDWDFEKALTEDREFERRLPFKEFLVLLLVLVALGIRLIFG